MNTKDRDQREQERDTIRDAPQPLPNEPYYHARERPRFDGRLLIGIALVVLGLVWLISPLAPPVIGGTAIGREVSLVDQTLPIGEITIDAGSADVIIERVTGGNGQIAAIQRGGGAGDFDVQIVRDGDQVQVRHDTTPCFFFCMRSLTYRIGLPEGATAAVNTLSGDVQISGAGGELDITTASGDVEIDTAGGPLQVTTISGDVEIGAVQEGPVAISTTSGDIDLRSARGAIAAQSVSGQIDMRDAQADTLALSTTSGDIRYDGALRGDGSHRVASISGDVELRLPESNSLAFNASTVSGNIRSAFSPDGDRGRRQLSGTIGDTTATLQTTLTIETTSGDIEIERR